ncbi:hypothetical protein OIDMADRAFT_177687 [Oidiodendron maius Zn]|uniref:Uncharacterized protein n=1 Tax=Oidiodendron maius (strain Zn) TaxID=913774 RepID=A0A0C3HKB8_OIDMZ|nr:hypothetical protein OIDMADRAFT_177687 [Oidiodendron maius Zn]
MGSSTAKTDPDVIATDDFEGKASTWSLLHIMNTSASLGSLLRQVTKKASHPNALIYEIQLARAKHKHLVQGQLEDGEEDAVALPAPKEGERQEDVPLVMKNEDGRYTMQQDSGDAEARRIEVEQGREKGENGTEGKGKEV